MTRDEAGYAYQYDAESRLVGFSAPAPATYSYDGAGQRVKKVVGTGSLAVKTIFVYDAGGTLVAEYATNTAGSASGTSYLTLDRLGSTRIVTNGVIVKGGQNIKARYDYLPFGEEISSSYGNRSAVIGYTPSETTRQKFTGYERDIESGLDFAQARYYANKQGRFISADSVGGKAVNPQTLNRYAYTGNNPLNNVDPTGHMYFGISAAYNGSENYGYGQPDYDPGLVSHIWAQINRLGEKLDDEAEADAEHYAHQQREPGPENPPPGSSLLVYWSAGGDSTMGHLALLLSDGTYISFYPGLKWNIDNGHEGADPVSTIMGKEYQGKFQTKAHDFSDGSRYYAYEIKGLDENGIRNWFASLKANPPKWSISYNCADMIAQTLQVGGLNLKNNLTGYSTARRVKNLAMETYRKERITKCPEVPAWRSNYGPHFKW